MLQFLWDWAAVGFIFIGVCTAIAIIQIAIKENK